MQKENSKYPSKNTQTHKFDKLTIALIAFLIWKSHKYNRKPMAIPEIYLQRALKCSRQEIRTRLNTLYKSNLLQKWTTKHPTHYKQTYIRFKSFKGILIENTDIN